MDALRKEEFYTTDDIYALPDGERAELIDGQIYLPLYHVFHRARKLHAALIKLFQTFFKNSRKSLAKQKSI